MTDDCIFCQIIEKNVPASFVYEDERVVAFLSNFPVNEGHTLVVPKEHYVNIYDIPEEDAAYLFKIAKKIALAVKDAFAAPGIRLVQNSEKAAEQVIFHMHVHVIPMYLRNERNHDGAYRDKTKPRNLSDLEVDAEKIRQILPKLKKKLSKCS